MQETVRYTYRLRPGKTAEAALLREAELARWVWNQCVATCDYERSNGGKPSPAKMDKHLTAARHKQPWLAAGSSVVQQQAIRDWGAARAAAFKVSGRRHPVFKSKKRDRPSINLTRRAFALKAYGERTRLRIPGGHLIPVVWSRELPSEPSSVRIYQDACGDWLASFVVRRDSEVFSDVDAAIGIDWGVKTPATTTDPEFDLEAAEYAKKAAKRLAHYQRRMARRKPTPGKKASNGYKQAKRTVAKQHRKVTRQRQDTNRKWARKVVEHHDRIAVEDFKPTFLAKSTMARKAADNAVGQTKAELINYAERAGRDVRLVPPAYTTMTCSECGAKAKQRLGLSERTFACSECGLALDRDLNAARTILAHAGFNVACVDGVRHDPPFEVARAS